MSYINESMTADGASNMKVIFARRLLYLIVAVLVGIVVWRSRI